jgi:flagellar motor switch protein FliM
MTRNTDVAEQYDFRSPSRLATSVEQRLAEWQRGVCKLFSERLNQHLPFAIKFNFVDVNPQLTRKALSSLSNDTYAFQFKVGNESLPCLFTLSQPFLLLLVNGMLGEISTELPENRELSHIERELSDIVAEELAVAVAEAFVGEEPISCKSVGCESRPERTRIFPRDSIGIVSAFEVELTSSAQSCQFIFPYSVVDLLPLASQNKSPDSSETRRQLESIVLSVPLTLDVQLGSVDLKIRDAANLQVGDVIVLDQPASEPLVAAIDGQPQFRVWPGKIGNRRAVQVAEDE